MAEITKGFKMSDELRDRINTIIEASEMNDKEWIEVRDPHIRPGIHTP